MTPEAAPGRPRRSVVPGPAALAGWAVVVLLLAPGLLQPVGTAGAHPVFGLNPLYNHDFDLGFPVTLDTSEEPLGEVFSETGSLAPIFMDNRSKVPAPGWWLRVFSGQRLPHSHIEWDPNDGAPEPVFGTDTPSLLIYYDLRDDGPETLIVTQPLGQRPHAGAFKDPASVTFWAQTAAVDGHPIRLRAGVYTVEDRHEPVVTDWIDVFEFREPGRHTLDFPNGTGTVTQFFLAVEAVPGDDPGDEPSLGARIWIDDVHLEGTTVSPGADPSDPGG